MTLLPSRQIVPAWLRICADHRPPPDIVMVSEELIFDGFHVGRPAGHRDRQAVIIFRVLQAAMIECIKNPGSVAPLVRLAMPFDRVVPQEITERVFGQFGKAIGSWRYLKSPHCGKKRKCR